MVRRLPVLPKLPTKRNIVQSPKLKPKTIHHTGHKETQEEQPGTKSQSILRLSPRLRASAVKILICVSSALICGEEFSRLGRF